MSEVQMIVAVVAVNASGVLVLLAGMFRALQRGDIVTRREADGITADRDMWRGTAQTLTPVVEKVLAGQDTTNRLLRALPGIAEVDR